MAGELLPWADQRVGIGGGSSAGPAICGYLGRLYAAWKGVGTDERMFWASFDGATWTAQQAGIGGGSSASPSLAVFQNRLFAAWKGVGDDQRMFWASFDGSTWSTQQVGIGGGTSDAPAIAVFQNRLYAVWKGAGTDERMFWSSFDGSTWSVQEPGVGGGTSSGPTLAVFQNRLYAAWKGVGSDQRMFWSSFDGARWADQQVGIGGGTEIGPAVAVYAVGLPNVDDRLFAAWKGVGDDQRMFWSMFDGKTWTVQQPGIGGGTSTRPSLAPFGQKLYAAWKGVGDDQRMFWSSLDVVRTPLQPQLASPASGAINQSRRPSFSWIDPGAGTVRAADTYAIAVTTPNYPNYDSFAINDITKQPDYNPSVDLNYGQDYIWRITPFNGQGLEQMAGPSANGKFSVEKAPAPPPPPPTELTCNYEIDESAEPSEFFDTFLIYGGGFKLNEAVSIVGIPDRVTLASTIANGLGGAYSVAISFPVNTQTALRAEGASGNSPTIIVVAT